MLLIIEIILIIPSVLFLYLKREQAKIIVKKIISHRLFPKIFWGIILGAGFLYFDWLQAYIFNESKFIIFYRSLAQIQGLRYLIGPFTFLGIFIGITMGASTRPFTLKKFFLCIFANFIGAVILTIRLFSSDVGAPQALDLLMYTLILTPLAIGIADRSFFKIIIGCIGGVAGWFLILVLVLEVGNLAGGNFPFGYSPPTSMFLSKLVFVFGTPLIILGIELSELMVVKTFKEMFKYK